VITAYQFAKTVNALLAAADIEKVLPPQMFYTYYKKGFVKPADQTQAGAVAWAAKYVRKHYPEVMEQEHASEHEIIVVTSERVNILPIEA